MIVRSGDMKATSDLHKSSFNTVKKLEVKGDIRNPSAQCCSYEICAEDCVSMITLKKKPHLHCKKTHTDFTKFKMF